MKASEKSKTKAGADSGKLTANSPRKRKAQYYHLSEADHETIKDGLRRFISVYQIAAKIGCGYTTLKLYINKHPELLQVQKDANDGMVEFAQSKLMRKIAEGSLGAVCFFLERKAGWTQHNKVENVGDLPMISFGLIPESDYPTDGVGEPVKVEPKKESVKVDEAKEEAETRRAERTDPDEVSDEDGEDDGGDDDWDDDSSGGGMF